MIEFNKIYFYSFNLIFSLMKKKIFSSLLIAAFGFAVTSSVVSCKDYDDDINDLQSQINKLATQDALNNMQTTLNSAITASESKITGLLAGYATKADLDGVKTIAENAGTAAATAQQAANDAATLAGTANTLAGQAKDAARIAQETADQAKTAAGTADIKAQQGIDDAKKAMEKAVEAFNKANTEAGAKELAQQAKDLAEQLKKSTADFVTKADLAKQVADATDALAPTVSNAATALTKAQEADQKAGTALEKAEAALAAVGTGTGSGVSKEEVAKMIKEAAGDMTDAMAAAILAQKAAGDAMEKAVKAYDLADGADKKADKLAGDVQTLAANAYTKAEAETLKGTVDGLVQALAEVATKEDLNLITGEAAVVGAAVDELFQAVTNVEIYSSIFGNYEDAGIIDGGAYENSMIDFIKAEEVDGVFPKNAVGAPEKDVNGKQYTFKAGDIKTFTDSVIVRVSPSNADLTKAQAIKLINSKGNNLDEYVEVVKVEQYTKLLTRAANASGLWTVTFKLKENYNPENFLTSVQVKEGKDDIRNILFAVGVQNTEKDRVVCSSYDVTVGAYDAEHSSGDFLVKGLDGEWKSVEEIHNRYLHCEQKNYDGVEIPTLEVPELEWKASTKDIPTPAGKVIISDPANKNDNAVNRPKDGDNRQEEEFLPVVIDEKIEICIDGVVDEKGNAVPETLIKGFIVELDEKFALESNNSELAGWKYYEYENLDVLQDGNLGYVTIKDLKDVTPEGDIIGFRVYAVNLDGTIVNPDGRAFYVKVMPGVNNMDVALNITATKIGQLFSDKNYTLGKDEKLLPGTYRMEIKTEDKNYPNGQYYYTVNFLDKDKKLVKSIADGSDVKLTEADVKKITQIQFETNDIARFFDTYTYDQMIKVFDEDNVLTQVINCKMTKVMPTDVKDPQFRPKQEVDPTVALPKITSKDGTGAFIAFMIPNTYKWAAPWTFQLPSVESYEIQSDYADNGWKNLNNIFYNLNDNENYRFDFKTSYTTEDGKKKNQDLKEILYGNFFNSNPAYAGYWLAVQTEYIDGKTWHDVVLSGVYRGVSSYLDKNKNVKFGEDYAVNSSTKYKAMYACWHHAATYAWGVDKNKKSLQPQLQWEADPEHGTPIQQAKMNSVLIKSGYNAAVFEGTLEALLTKNFIKVDTEKEPKLTYGTQENPYFKPSIDATGKITFSQVSIQSDANPTADHTENLTINFLDAYGHEIAVVLPVVIKKAAASAAKGI